MRLVRACINFLFLLRTHAAKWMQHPFKNGTHAPCLMQIARKSERGLRDFKKTLFIYQFAELQIHQCEY